MKCLETRKRNGMKWRRYRTDDGRTVTTFELPTAVLSRFSKKQVAAALAAWERGEAQRARRVLVVELLARGVKPTAIAHELGITDQAVRQTRKALHAAA